MDQVQSGNVDSKLVFLYLFACFALFCRMQKHRLQKLSPTISLPSLEPIPESPQTDANPTNCPPQHESPATNANPPLTDSPPRPTTPTIGPDDPLAVSMTSSGYSSGPHTPSSSQQSDSTSFLLRSDSNSSGGSSVTNSVTNDPDLVALFRDANTVQLPKATAKRASELYKHLPQRNKVMRGSVMLHSFNRMLKSPNSKHTFAGLLKGNKRFVSVCQTVVGQEVVSNPVNMRITRQVRQLARLRAQNKWEEIDAMRRQWKTQKISLTSVAKIAQMSLTTLRWHLNPPKGKGNRKVSDKDKENVIEFFSRNNITMQLPFKRYHRKLYLRSAMHKAYSQYKKEMSQNAQRILSLTAVHRVLPRKCFCPASTVPFHQCLCNVCENFRLILLAAVHAGVKGVSRRTNATCISSMCEVQSDATEKEKDILSYKKECVWRQCKDCSHKFSRDLTEANKDLDMSRNVTWHQWEGVYQEIAGKRVKVNFAKIQKHGPLADLVSALKLQMVGMPKHLFLYQWQGQQFEIARKNLEPGEVLMVMDFAKNIQFERQREVQGAFWYRKSVTLHPCVCYYLCPKGCGRTVTDEIMCVTNDLTHDAHAVAAFEKCALKHLADKGIKPTRLIEFTDNCSAQYKCFTSFGYITHADFPIERHYFGPGHGKGPGDSSVGRTKGHVDRGSRSDEPHGDLQDAQGLTEYCRKHLSTCDTDSEHCVHFRRHFYHVRKIRRRYKCEFKTLKGTTNYHCVKKTGTLGRLLFREISCFCR